MTVVLFILHNICTPTYCTVCNKRSMVNLTSFFLNMAAQPGSTWDSNGSNVISLRSNESLSCCWSADWSWKHAIKFITLFTPSSISSLQLPCSVISRQRASAISQYIFIFNSFQVEAKVFQSAPVARSISLQQVNVIQAWEIYQLSSLFCS